MSIGVIALALQYFAKPDEIRKQYTSPVLLWSQVDDKPRKEETTIWPTRNKPRRGEPLVVPLKKAAAGDTAAPAPVIIVGRSNDCDVVLSDSTISRLHCRFEHDAATNQWYVVDESKSGTWIDDQRLKRGERQQVPPSAKIRLGSVDMMFFQPENFFQYLAENFPA